MYEVESYSGSLPTGWTWSATNLYNQHAAAVTIPANSAIMALEINASARGSSVSTRCVLWNVGGSVLRQSATFTMAARADGSQIWQGAKNITAYPVSSQTTYWIGLYRRANGSHTFRVGSGTGYRKTNTATWANVTSMSDYNSHSDRRPVVRAYYILRPATPTGIGVARTSDNKYTITWSRTSTSGNPVTNIFVERYNNVSGTWSQVAKLGNVASFADTGTIANRSYRWRVRAWNAAGYSSYLTSTTYKTTPANPSNVVAKRSGSNVVITWTRQDTTADNYVVQRSVDGGAFSQLTASLPGTAVTYNDTSPGSLNIYKILARVSTPTTLTSTGTNSNSVQTLAAPSKPTNLYPTGLQPIDFLESIRFTWQHNPNDSSDQTKFSLEYADNSEFTSSTLISEEISSSEFYDFDSEEFDNGETYYWRVKTWGAYATGSEWSDTATFVAASKPEPAITNPGHESTYNYSELTIEWDYADFNSYNQGQYILKLYDENDNLLENKTGISGIESGESDSKIFDYRLLNNTNYYVTLQVRNSINLLSDEVRADFTTEFLNPPKPVLELTNNRDGTVTLNIVNPAHEENEEESVYNRVFRKVLDEWELVYDNVELNTNIIDYLPSLSGTTFYYIETVSAVPSSNTSYIEEIVINVNGLFILNSGNSFEDNLILFGDINFSETFDREKELLKFAGREKPLKFEGEHIDRVINLSAYLALEDYDKYVKLVNNEGNNFYRDWRGRWFKCDVQNSNISKKENFGYQANFVIIEVD